MANEYDKKFGRLREYMESKYGKAYLTAISKLSVSDPYDENGVIKTEYVLTSDEEDALRYFIPETEQFLDQNDNSEREQKSLDKRYQEFLEDVRKNTEKVASFSQASESNADMTWEIVGVEFLGWKVVEKYGDDIYQKASEEVPHDKVGYLRAFYRRIQTMFHRDFSKANIKLGHLIREAVAPSILMDLDYFIKLLEEKGIPSYIDFETNTFHYNAVPKKEKEKKL